MFDVIKKVCYGLWKSNLPIKVPREQVEVLLNAFGVVAGIFPILMLTLPLKFVSDKESAGSKSCSVEPCDVMCNK